MDFSSLFSPQSYGFNALSIPNILISGMLTHLGIATLIEPRGRSEAYQARVNQAWFIVCMTVVIWQFCFAMLYMSRNDQVALFWDKAAYIGVISIPPCFLRFTILYLKLTRLMPLWFLLQAIGIGFICLIPTNLLVQGIRHYAWGPYTDVGPWHTAFMVYFVLTMSLSFFLFFLVLLHEEYPLRRSQIRKVFITFLAADLGAFDYLPAYGVDVPPLGNISIIGFMSLATWFIARHRALELSPALAAEQILSAMTNLLIVFQRDRRVVFVNKAMVALTRRPSLDYVGNPLEDILGPRVLADQSAMDVLDQGGNLSSENLDILSIEGESIPVGFTFSAIRENKGPVLGYVGLGWDRRPELERLALKESLLESQKKAYAELQLLDQAKEKMIHHLAHEIKTPVAIIAGNIGLLERSPCISPQQVLSIHERLDRNLRRLNGLADEAVDIVSHVEFAGERNLERMLVECQDILETLIEERADQPSLVHAMRARIHEIYHIESSEEKVIHLKDWLSETIQGLSPFFRHRAVRIEMDLLSVPSIRFPEPPLSKTVIGLTRNAIENTPDGGRVIIRLHERDQAVFLEIWDFGVGIDPEFQKQMFLGFVHAADTNEYRSRTPYSFGGGGRGGDLLRIKLFSEKLGFRLDVESRPCRHTNSNGKCPGDIRKCSFYETGEGSCKSGGSKFRLEFPSSLFAQSQPVIHNNETVH